MCVWGGGGEGMGDFDNYIFFFISCASLLNLSLVLKVIFILLSKRDDPKSAHGCVMGGIYFNASFTRHPLTPPLSRDFPN